jgi:hypothetical protein
MHEFQEQGKEDRGERVVDPEGVVEREEQKESESVGAPEVGSGRSEEAPKQEKCDEQSAAEKGDEVKPEAKGGQPEAAVGEGKENEEVEKNLEDMMVMKAETGDAKEVAAEQAGDGEGEQSMKGGKQTDGESGENG